MGKNVIIFGADLSSSVHIYNQGKYILIHGEGPKQGQEDTTLAAEAKYSINFTQSNRKFILSLHYNESDSFLFVNATKIYQFKAKKSEIKQYPLCLGNISKDFTFDNMKKRKKGSVLKCNFFLLIQTINTNEILYFHRYSVKELL